MFDRPSGAAAAAVELQEAIRREPWALADPMRIRIALHTGEVEFRDGDYFGRAVNRAARLRSLALGGQILCSGATAELVIDSLADDVVRRAIDLTTAAHRHGLLRDLPPNVTALAVIGAVETLMFRFFDGRDIGDPLIATRALITMVLDGLRRDAGSA